MKIRSIETFRITLPFRFSFGHSLASRSESTNLIVKVTLSNGAIGFGEGIPRDYVTGEDIENAEANVLSTYAPLFLSGEIGTPRELVSKLRQSFTDLGLREKPCGASWCAFELAMLDAFCKNWNATPDQVLGPIKNSVITYGGVVPFGGKRALGALLLFYKLYGFRTIKLKVGKDLDLDLEKLKTCRAIMGDQAIIRVDANCAWDVNSASRAIEAFRPYKVASYEQPLPADDWEGLQKLTANFTEDIMVDESLCTLSQAEELARNKICSAFNIRISKAGGILPAMEMLKIANKFGLRVQMGAQVGETGILTAAGRYFACLSEPLINYEGAANSFLLKRDLTNENLTARPGGTGDLKFSRNKPGLGITINDKRLLAFTHEGTAMNGAHPEHVAAL